LGGGSEELKKHVEHFINQYKADMSNEKFPAKEYKRRQTLVGNKEEEKE
jgi:hypothetical protein